MQCQAKSKRTHEQCRRHASIGKKVCYIHGGRTPSGAKSPHFITGRWSRAMPVRLLERYHEAVNDSKLLELRAEIALCDARVCDILGRTDTGESGVLWQSLRDTYQQFEAGRDRYDSEAVMRSLQEIGALIHRGADDIDAWSEIMIVIERRRKLTESEWRRLVRLRNVVTAEEVLTLIEALSQCVRRAVDEKCPDRATASAILEAVGSGLREIIGRIE